MGESTLLYKLQGGISHVDTIWIQDFKKYNPPTHFQKLFRICTPPVQSARHNRQECYPSHAIRRPGFCTFAPLLRHLRFAIAENATLPCVFKTTFFKTCATLVQFAQRHRQTCAPLVKLGSAILYTCTPLERQAFLETEISTPSELFSIVNLSSFAGIRNCVFLEKCVFGACRLHDGSKPNELKPTRTS